MVEPTGLEGAQGVGTNWCRNGTGCWNRLVWKRKKTGVEGEQKVGTNWCQEGTGCWSQMF